MDQYALQQELEALAGNAINPDVDDDNTTAEPMSNTIARWQRIFNISQDEAVDRIQDHRNNLTRTRILDSHWDMIRAEKETQGYDREAYEYEVELQKKKAALPDLMPASDNTSVTYLVEMDGPLDSPEKVQLTAGTRGVPSVVRGRSVEDGRVVELCCIDSTAKAALLQWAAGEGGGYEPTIIVNPRSLR